MAVILNASTSSGFVQSADTSGEITLQSNGTTRLSVLSTGVSGTLVQGTAVASTSGTTIDFTGIPSWVRRITVIYAAVSTSGTSAVIVQLGAGSFEATGYLGSGANGANAAVAFTTGIPSVITLPAANTFYGTTTIVTAGSNAWVGNSTIGSSATGNPQYGAAGKTIGGTLDRIRITTVNGTDTFDAGSINIQYEG
jgi:hypothetical protein